MTNQVIYTVGGTVQAGGGIYIPRRADDELLQYCRRSEFAFILSSRQVGKSSLMVRTASQLERENIRSVIIDLSSIGVRVSADEWYLGILNEIATTLNLKTDIFGWWSERNGLGPAQRLSSFFREVLLKEIHEPIVLFFDEIDSTLSIPFADDFFASLRAVYNARATVEELKRLSFVMIGVATPGDLISDRRRTPFNIGHRVDLEDFTYEEALPLAGELGPESLKWILAWTGGHPYLTQRLCAHLSKNEIFPTEDAIESAVKQLFEGEQGRQDNNLQFVRDMLTKRAPDIHQVLKTYKDVRLGKKVTDDERSVSKSHLKISGVVRRENARLRPRNRIYERTFDLKWIQENTPPTTARRLMFASTLITVMALIIAGYFAWQDYSRTPAERAAKYESDFQSTQDPKSRLNNLSGLFELNDDSYSIKARQLFNDMSQENKLALFSQDQTWGVAEDQEMVVEGLYMYMGNTEDENEVLEVMATAAPLYEDEITYWLAGRRELNEKDYTSALAYFDLAITENPSNPALYYDRAQAYVGLGKADAFADFDKIIELNPDYDLGYFYLQRGLASYSFGDINQSIRDFEKAIQYRPDDPDIYYWRGTAYFSNNNYLRAIEDFSKAIELDPDDPLPYYHRGLTYFNQGDYNRAIADYTRVIKINPADVVAYVSRGRAYLYKAQYDQALADYNKAIDIDPSYYLAYHRLGDLYQQTDRQELAIAEYGNSIKYNPNYAGSYNNRCWVYAKLGEYEKALPDCEKAIALAPDEDFIIDSRAVVYMALGRTNDAIKDFERVLEMSLEILLRKRAVYELERTTDAPDFSQVDYGHILAVFNKSISLNPNDSNAFNSRCWIYYELGRYEEALVDCQKAISLDASSFNALDSRALVYLALGRTNDAIKDFEQILEIPPDSDFLFIWERAEDKLQEQ